MSVTNRMQLYQEADIWSSLRRHDRRRNSQHDTNMVDDMKLNHAVRGRRYVPKVGKGVMWYDASSMAGGCLSGGKWVSRRKMQLG